MSKLHLEIDGPIATLRLDNPAKLNALTFAMLEDLERHCALLDRSQDVKCVILAAVNAPAFCAGADIKEWGALTATDFARNWVREGHRIFDRFARLSKPTIAAIGAHAFGGGLELAATADIRVMSPDATLALPEARVGIIPGWSGTQRLARLLPEPMLKEMALFGRKISADRAYQVGFVAQIAEGAEDAARRIATGLMELSPRSTEVAKYMIHAGVGEDRAALTEALGAGLIGATPEKAEGVAAFMSKRKPEF